MDLFLLLLALFLQADLLLFLSALSLQPDVILFLLAHLLQVDLFFLLVLFLQLDLFFFLLAQSLLPDLLFFLLALLFQPDLLLRLPLSFFLLFQFLCQSELMLLFFGLFQFFLVLSLPLFFKPELVPFFLFFFQQALLLFRLSLQFPASLLLEDLSFLLVFQKLLLSFFQSQISSKNSPLISHQDPFPELEIVLPLQQSDLGLETFDIFADWLQLILASSRNR